MSPTSMKLTLRLLKEAKEASNDLSSPPLTGCLKREYRAVYRCITPGRSDFFEGIRAALVDKDRQPKWQPETAEGVSDVMIDGFLEGFGEEVDKELNMPRLPGFKTP